MVDKQSPYEKNLSQEHENTATTPVSDTVKDEPKKASVHVADINNTTDLLVPRKDDVDTSGDDLFADDIKADNNEETIEPNFFDVSENTIQDTGLPDNIFRTKKAKELSQTERDFALHLHSGTTKSVVASTMQASPSLGASNPEQVREWAAAFEQSGISMLEGGQLDNVSVREGSVWSHAINHAETGQQPNYRGPVNDRKGVNPNDKNDTRSIALNRMTTILGLGSTSYIPLYHTGIWVQLRTPTVAAFAELDERITKERVEYGTLTRGEIFSNESVIMRRLVANFILDHITYTNAPGGTDRSYLKSIIKVTDLDELMRGIMQTRYPDGYPYRQPCTADPNNCQHVVEGIIDLREIQWTDTTALTSYQKNIMYNPRRRLTEEQLSRYQQEFNHEGYNQIRITRAVENGEDDVEEALEPVINGVVLHIETPTLAQDEEYGLRWINLLRREVEEVLTNKNDQKERAELLAQRSTLTYFKTYGQWVKSIDIYDKGEILQSVTDVDEIDEIFDFISSDISYIDKFSKGVKKYAEKTLVHLIGFKNYECPNCGKKHDTREGNFHIIVPIDMLSVFFILIRSSVLRAFRTSNM